MGDREYHASAGNPVPSGRAVMPGVKRSAAAVSSADPEGELSGGANVALFFQRIMFGYIGGSLLIRAFNAVRAKFRGKNEQDSDAPNLGAFVAVADADHWNGELLRAAQERRPVVAWITAAASAPCQQAAPELAAFSMSPAARGATCLRIDAERTPEIVDALGISAVPSMLVLRDAQLVGGMEGINLLYLQQLLAGAS
ncbi:unnamed protein product [Pedinophyceae sp. YPF-701]|nr:unnamed protein product [Pedinophyceae sp. YPF-701]